MVHGIKLQRRRQRRRDALIDAAAEIVAEHGVDGLTMAGLAEATDSSVGAAYRYFAGKDALVTALQVDAVDRFGAYLEQTLASAPADPLERVATAFLAYLRYAEAEPHTFGLIDASLSDPRRLLDDAGAAEVEARLQPVLATCAATLQAAVDAGALAPGDAVLRTHALWASLHGVGHFRKRDGRSPVRAAALAEVVVRGLLAGWAPR